MDIEKLYKLYLKYKKIETDTRKLTKDSIFWALQGENFDANKFVTQALEKKAGLVVTSNKQFIENNKCFYVENTLTALQKLAKFHREQLKIPIIGITGTNGKTTTKELITCVLSENYEVSSTAGNFNNHIGVPLTLLSFNEETEIGVVEMGANHPKEIEFLCNIAKPNFGIITNIGKAHIEGFGSFTGVKNTKKELYDYIYENNGTVFYNSDNNILNEIIGLNKFISYGKENANITAKLENTSEYVSLKINFTKKHTLEINTKIFGNYNFENILVAATVGNYFDIDSEKIKNALESYIPANNRSQIIKNKTNTIILDAYNANPSSMNAALDNFFDIKSDKKVIIIGDMLELGKESSNEHQKIVKRLSNLEKYYQVFFVGKEFIKAISIEKSNLLSFSNAEKVSEYLKKTTFIDSYILIKGSRGIKLESILDSL